MPPDCGPWPASPCWLVLSAPSGGSHPAPPYLPKAEKIRHGLKVATPIVKTSLFDIVSVGTGDAGAVSLFRSASDFHLIGERCQIIRKECVTVLGD